MWLAALPAWVLLTIRMNVRPRASGERAALLQRHVSDPGVEFRSPAWARARVRLEG